MQPRPCRANKADRGQKQYALNDQFREMMLGQLCPSYTRSRYTGHPLPLVS